MNVPPVLVTVDGNTPDPHLSAGPEHPDSNLPPIGHQHPLDGPHLPFLASVGFTCREIGCNMWAGASRGGHPQQEGPGHGGGYHGDHC